MRTAEVVIILTAVPEGDQGDAIARALVEERLAACVHVHPPMTSVYRWRNEVHRDAEQQLVVKTTRDRVAAIEARIRELHPYELPEFVVLSIADGSAAYLSWLIDETAEPDVPPSRLPPS